jgi:signal transduction histidine kinase
MQVEEVVEQVVMTMQARAMDQGLTLRSELPSTLPEVMADPDRVAQILTNLVGNACNYTLDGGEVTVSACVYSDQVRVSVHDTGIGISKEDREKIFDRFFRADDSVVQDAPGTGLGLAIVRSLTEMQGGQVWVESELGEGSTFTFALPTADSRQLPEEAEPA